MAIHHPQLLQRRDFRISPQEGPGDDCGRKNARFLGAKSEIKTDVSEDGLQKGAPPAIVATGMMGDRADVIFSEPEEISRIISPGC